MLPDNRIRQRDYLLEIARALTVELDLQKLLGRIITISIEMLAGQAGLIALREPGGGWRVQVSGGLPSRVIRVLNSSLSRVFAQDNPEASELPGVHAILQEFTDRISQGQLRGIGLPLLARRQLVGVIYIFRAYPELLSSNDSSLLSSFANQAAIAVQNAQFYQQIVQEKQRTDALLDSAADGILILRSDLRIDHANPTLTRMLGLPHGSALGHSHSEVIRWVDHPSSMTLEEAISRGWPFSGVPHLYVEGDLIRVGDRSPLPIGITYAPLLSEDNQLINVIATVRDITRFRQAEELKTTFISIVSHELKTPVALIKGYASTLRRDDADWDSEIVQESLEVIEEEADRLSQLIENLLDATRLQSQGFSLKRSDVDIASLVQRVADKMQTQTSQHTITVNLPDDFPIVMADENRIQQVLINLLSNAIKYAPSGEIQITGQVRTQFVILCVTDQGPGIQVDDIPHVFDRFYRSAEAARQTKGAGLGLFLTRAIVEAHEGRIWVDPYIKEGARICFSLPRPSPDAKSA